jgi:3-oxoacyl-[acyl-carrier-protein] synthase II
MRRVVVSGVGLVTPVGTGTEKTWQALLSGRSAIGPVRAYDASGFRTQTGAEIPDLNAEDFGLKKRVAAKMTRGDLISVAGAKLAAEDAGLEIDERDIARIGVFTGSNKEVSDVDKMVDGVLAGADEQGRADTRRFGEQALDQVYPLFFIEGLQAGSLFYISDAFGVMGANTYFAGLAEAGLIAVGRGYRAVRRGEADVVIAGGYDDPVSWWAMGKWDGLGVLSTRNDEAALRPWDRDRDGTVMGEGAAFLVLEEAGRARARGATVYAEIVGFGTRMHPQHLFAPDPDGTMLAHAVEAALREAATSADEIGYTAAHGSGNVDFDASEARALRSVLGAGNHSTASSVKAATGHLGAGAGALNAAVAALAVRHGAVPPTLHLDHVDPECEGVDWVPGEARETDVRQALALARGFEGQNVALALRAIG